ncbi:MAG: N-(5'-phosphoribosyl)anthranilate isomerase [Desulfobacteraceae bacterium 4484_190.1]|nr:MAG: N-(5'-phosphoribosyl)anthranilate isomerase [Desulfobacteraceae bacterium 4484_190.1]
MVRIKICGITNYEDAVMAVKVGACALGFIFAESPRRIEPEKVREIISKLPPFVQTVGVFVDEELLKIREIIDFCGLDMVQLHGDEPPDFCRELMPRAIKAVRFKDESSLKLINTYYGMVRGVLFDTYSKEKRGGTGKSFDWDLALKGKEMGIPVILAGGLMSSNIEEAFSVVRPYALDVNSGVEDRPGKKDPVLMKSLARAVRRIEIGGLTDG